ncbi:MAG: hypothetical protein HZA52_13685 [Planctomycetes bacterium]|nr:hypothetical protein [Planctomycetota bacterium]
MDEDHVRQRAATEPRARRRKLAALGCGMLVAFALGEVAARALYGAPLSERLPLMTVRAHPTRGFEMVPSSEHFTYRESVRINALGLRGAELGPKADGERRVFVVGDSTTFGQGVAEDQTLPAWLERELGAPVRAINGGVRSYDTAQELALLEELAPRVEPDVVVLAWYFNDLEAYDLPALAARFEASGPVVFDFGAPDGFVARTKWHAKQLARRSALLMRLHDVWRELVFEPPTAAEVEQAFARLERELARMKELGAELDFDVVVAVVPAARALRESDATDPRTTRVLAVARDQGLAALDLRPAMRALALELGEAPIVPYDGHYDGRANRAMARELASHLRAHCAARLAPAK